MSPFWKIHDYYPLALVWSVSLLNGMNNTQVYGFSFHINSYYNLMKTIFLCFVVSLQGDQGIKVSHNLAALQLCYNYFIKTSLLAVEDTTNGLKDKDFIFDNKPTVNCQMLRNLFLVD